MEKIADLIPRVETSWQSLSCVVRNKTEKNKTSSDNTRFWKQAWEKHGTCSDSILDQHAYFEGALKLKDRVDLLQILQSNGIKPDGNFYSVVNITRAIKEAIGFVPGIKCNTDPFGNRQLNDFIFLWINQPPTSLNVQYYQVEKVVQKMLNSPSSRIVLCG